MSKIVVIGGTGLIGAKTVALLQARGHEVVAAARATGVNSYTGDGLADALEGAQTVVDTSNSSYTDEAGALDFFETSTLNLLSYGAAAGVANHVALSVVGTERLAATEGGYFRAKHAQEQLIRESGRLFTIVHGTQFFEFIGSIADAAVDGDRVRVAEAFIRPMAADDVAAAVVRAALAAPVGGIVENAGPEEGRLDGFVRRRLAFANDPREVSADPLAAYFGSRLGARDLLPGPDATLATTDFDTWSRAALVR
ncbi:SDR family oxidoreductase [Herbiconiux sp. P17]|uniref:SDR family oxidoreductase n=1 Tax=Herbiconiux wuyangfengii TaxID=3342794 RepID=UPI0035B8F6CC